MSIRQSIQLAQKPRSTSVETSQQRLADDLSSLFTVLNRLVTELDSLGLRRVAVPATSASAGDPGNFATDANYFYYCTAANSWKRIAFSTF